MTDVTVIIVSYNVRHFLIQCLESVFSSDLDNIALKVVVVDNDSVDGSVIAVRQKFPQVEIIANDENLGFGRANNQAIRTARSTYTLLLNPDTVLSKDTIRICIDAMEEREDIGALGVKMVDGNGQYLRESKRSLPGLMNSLYKMTGLARLFPNSPTFNAYYTRDLSGNDDENVEVLCGAFMFCRTRILQELGGFDEAFFMYGEDIDLSKRMNEAGYILRYTAATSIIHFKGESSRKASLSYLHSFYHSMMIYTAKHYKGNKAFITNILIKTAILLFGLIRSAKEYSMFLLRPMIDFVVFYTVFNWLKDGWSLWYFHNIDYYNPEHFRTNNLLYTTIWVLSLWFWGWYDRKARKKNLAYGIFSAGALILIIYALLPFEYRSSRVLILLGSIMAFVIALISRKFQSMLISIFSGKKQEALRKILLVCEKGETPVIQSAFGRAFSSVNFIGVVSPKPHDKDAFYLNSLDKLDEVIRTYRVNEVVFSLNSLQMDEIISYMTQPEQRITYRLFDLQHRQIIGSESSRTQGSFYEASSAYNLSKQVYRRLKRSFDLLSGLLLILFLPFMKMFSTRARSLKWNAVWQLLIGKKTLIGFRNEDNLDFSLPPITEGLIPLSEEIVPVFTRKSLNHWYASNYSPIVDIEIVFSHLRK